MEVGKEKKILDVTCGMRSIWFNKNHPNALYCDKRDEDFELAFGRNHTSVYSCHIHPDVLCDFTALPFQDNSFYLVVWDPPHLTGAKETSWLVKKYGKLDKEWPKMLHDGFRECMRVLKPNGVLVFKWSEYDVPAEKVWKAIGEKPLFGHHSAKNSTTFWGCYMKLVEQSSKNIQVDGERTGARLTVRPCKLRDANRYVAQFHRHNQPTNGHKWSLACYDGDRLCGVAIAGSPVARKIDDGLTIEIRRVCTDGTYNACSILYGACARVAKAMGYKRVITYTLVSEPGTSLKASGFTNCGEAGGVSWDVPSRPRDVEQMTLFGTVRKYPEEKKIRWEKRFE